MAVPLNASNFVQEIKQMDARSRTKIRAEDLINLILQLPEPVEETKKFDDIFNLVTDIQKSVIANAQEITRLKDDNQLLREDKIAMSVKVDGLVEETNLLKSQVEGLEQYTRINNIEIVGLDKKPPGTETVEEMVLQCLNGMVDSERDDEEEEEKFSAADIDICHILPKHNREHSHVVRFLSRKAKIYALDLKKNADNRNYKFRTKTIYINEHLTSTNKILFNLAKERKQTLNYKHLWTRNGRILMRKTDESDVVKIDCEQTIATLS